MGHYLRNRLLQAVVVILIIIVGNFILLNAVPGDLVDVLAGRGGDMDADLMASLRARFGLDDPLPIRLLDYIRNVLTGNLGYSWPHSQPVLDVVLQRLPATTLLVILSVITSVFIGTLTGVFAARKAHKLTDVILSMVVLVCYATPIFLTALALMLIFSVQLGWFPLSGLTTAGAEEGILATAADMGRHLVLPVVSLSLFYVAIYARLSRASMLQVLTQDYVRTARAKGVSERGVILGHALRNALLPVITMAGLQITELFGGAVLTETIFGLPGVGRLAYDAVFARNFPLLLGILIVCSFIIVIVNLLVDLLYMKLDPRVELTK
ncbi:ABC transporter permease [Pseudooceanicola sp. CBS1P-1]|uniref:ABC transporter permease subunit n=1 Tax=Pseudooceanicola albus TaxID=2692189 RepID=A0A6L7G5E2_9RHOB|nr:MULTISPECIES: ABC transporter permease [Pseudooceanicola]MBT9385433.1 ABC transporter permease [Pseudooceanicola endophyticus]MXN18708.1 ABC transporter permease subunit [Pseudooceanicola albus]